MADETDNANVFISWSGTRSKQVATLLREWLPYVVNDAVPWMSAEDIAKGTVWSAEISKQLAACRICIVVITPENMAAPWILFEAGAIYKAMQGTRVCTLLFGLDPPLIGPLGQFQATTTTEPDMLRLCRDIDAALGSRSSTRIDKSFGKFWIDISAQFTKMPQQSPFEKQSKGPSERELLEEILGTVRATREHVAGFSAPEPTKSVEKKAHSDFVERAKEKGFNPWVAVEHKEHGYGKVAGYMGGNKLIIVDFRDSNTLRPMPMDELTLVPGET